MSRAGTITRRSFMGLGIAATGGVAVGYYFYTKPFPNPLVALAAEGDAIFNPYVKIAPDNTITIIAPRAEMGQGVHTTLAALVAEELDISLDQVSVEHGLPGKAYYNTEAVLNTGDPFSPFDEGFTAEATRGSMKVVSKFLALQVTGGSSTTIDAFVKMRKAGCAARLVLIDAAANHWGADAETLQTAGGLITNPANGKTLTYGEISGAAALLPPPSNLTLRPSSEWKILGKSQPRVEGLDKVTGGRIFSIDVQLPDMLYGTVKMSPRFGVGAVSVDKTSALQISGVLDIIEIETTTGSGFGVIAENTWAAFQGAEALEVEWGTPDYPADTDGMKSTLDVAMKAKADFSLGNIGNVEKEFENTEDRKSVV